jgi:putative sigma-54 modulation protein
MNVNIQTVRFDADSGLVEYVNRKLEKLSTFHDRIIKVNVFLKLDNVVHNIKRQDRRDQDTRTPP